MEKTAQGNLYYGNYKAQVLAHKPHGIIKLFVPGVTPISFFSSVTDEEVKMATYNYVSKQTEQKSSYLNVNVLLDTVTDDERNLYIEGLPDAHPALSLFGGTGAYNHSYSYPHIGSWVWCFFESGNHAKPVYFASIPGGEYAKYEYNEILAFNDDPNDRPNEIKEFHEKNNETIDFTDFGKQLVSYNQYNHRRHSFVTGKNKVTLEEDGRLLIEVGYVPNDKFLFNESEEQNVPYTEYTTPYGNNLDYKPVKPKSQESKTIIEICQSNISIKVPKSKKENVLNKDDNIQNIVNLSQNIEDDGQALQSLDSYNRTYTLAKNIEQDFKTSFNTRKTIPTVYSTPLTNLDNENTPETQSDNEAYYEAVINIDCEQKINIKCPQINIFSENINAYNADNINLVNGKNINLDNGDTINVHNGKHINVKNKEGNISVLNELGDISVTNTKGNISTVNTLGNISITNTKGNISTVNTLGDITVTNTKGNMVTENTDGNMTIKNMSKSNIMTIQSPTIEINGGPGIEQEFGVIKIKGDIIHTGKLIQAGNIMTVGVMDITGDVVLH